MMAADDNEHDVRVAAWLRSRGLRVVANLEGKGRAVVAAQAFRPGELICVCSPYAYAPSGVICNKCGSTPFSGTPRESGVVVDDVMTSPLPGRGGGGAAVQGVELLEGVIVPLCDEGSCVVVRNV